MTVRSLDEPVLVRTRGQVNNDDRDIVGYRLEYAARGVRRPRWQSPGRVGL